MNLGLVGSRNFNNYELFERAILKCLAEWKIEVKNLTIISGGAAGADRLAEIFAEKHSLPIVIYKPDWKLHGKAAGILRNTTIVDNSDLIIAFPSRFGKGTQDTISKAKKKGTKLKVLYVD